MNPVLLALTAETIVIDADSARGQGDVELTLEDQVARASAFSLDLETNALTLIDGRWERAAEGDVLTFARAEIQLGEDLSGVLLQARYTGERFIAEGDELVILDADTLQGGDLTVTVCRCEVPTWDVTARAVTVELDEVARFTGGWIRVCEQRVLPVPAGIVPLAERRSGLLPPRIGYGQDGVIAAQPVFLTLGESADLTAEPEWRQARGLRGRGTLRYALAPGGEGGQLDGALGYDQSQSRWRGAASVQHGWGPGPVWSAVDARYQSDPDYLADYGEDFLSRAAPWMESRALLITGPLRLETDTFQFTEPAQQRPAAAVLSAVHPAGPVSVFSYGRLDVFAEGDDPLALTDPTPRARGGVRMDAGRQFAAARADLRLLGEGVAWAGQAPWAWGGAEAEVLGQLWGDVGGWRHLADVGIVALGGASTADELSAAAPDESVPVAWGVGPSVTSRWLSAGGVPLSVSARAPWTAEGWAWLLTARWQAGAWSGRAQAEPGVAYAQGGWSAERHRVSLSAAYVEDLLQLGGQTSLALPGRLRPVALGWLHLYDALGTQTLSAGPTIEYRSPCDCLGINAGLIWSQDRAAPDARFSISVQ